MVCKKCGSNNINFQTVAEVKRKGKGLIYWLLIGWWLEAIMWVFLTLPWLIIKIFKPSKIKSRMVTYATCQNCGNSWKA